MQLKLIFISSSFPPSRRAVLRGVNAFREFDRGPTGVRAGGHGTDRIVVGCRGWPGLPAAVEEGPGQRGI